MFAAICEKWRDTRISRREASPCVESISCRHFASQTVEDEPRVCKRPDSSRRLLDDRQEVSAGERTRQSESLRHKLAKGFALDIPAGYGSEESGARRQNARWAIESNGLANTTRTKFSLRAA